jgi:hypothetical protein
MRSFVQTIIVALGVMLRLGVYARTKSRVRDQRQHRFQRGAYLPCAGTALLRQKFAPSCGDAHERLPEDGMRHLMFGAILIL